MATDQKQAAEPTTAPASPRVWRVFFAAIFIGCLLPLGLAYFCGPKKTATYEDPLTGRHKHESTWLGLTISSQVQENEVSKWADSNGNRVIFPDQYGWSLITFEERGWFTSTSIGCGGGFDIPGRIFRNQIVIDGLTPRETLRQYQAEFTAAYQESRSLIDVQKKWAATKKQ